MCEFETFAYDQMQYLATSEVRHEHEKECQEGSDNADPRHDSSEFCVVVFGDETRKFGIERKSYGLYRPDHAVRKSLGQPESSCFGSSGNGPDCQRTQLHPEHAHGVGYICLQQER